MTLILKMGCRFLAGYGLFLLFHCAPSHAHDPMHPLQPDRHSTNIEAKLAPVIAALTKAEASGVSQETTYHAQAVVWGSLVWRSHKITVCFWNGSKELRALVKDRASTWTSAADINFDFEDAPGAFRECKNVNSAQIRVSLDGADQRNIYVKGDDKGGNWSDVGRQSAQGSLVSLNLATLQTEPTPLDVNFLIRHEFGHALGFMHEHQRDTCRNSFNYDNIAADNHWTKAKAEEQVGLFPDSWRGLLNNYGPYDNNSIMQYNFQLDWYSDIPNNPCERDHDVDDLSDLDKKAAAEIYGKPVKLAHVAEADPADSAASQQAKGGDDKSHQDGWVSALTDADVKAAQDTLTAEAFKASFNLIVSGQNMMVANHICNWDGASGKLGCDVMARAADRQPSPETRRAEAIDQLSRSVNDFVTSMSVPDR